MLTDARLNEDVTGADFLCLEPRFPREWRYFPYARSSEDTMSGLLEVVR